MPNPMPVAVAAILFAVAGCTRAEQAESRQDVKAAAADIRDEAHDAANSPAVKKAGDDLKDAAGDVGHVLKESAKGAVDGARKGAAEAEGDADRTPADHDRR